jgi:hypothetical protein
MGIVELAIFSLAKLSIYLLTFNVYPYNYN